MSGLSTVNKFLFPKNVLDKAYTFLQEAGKERFEAVALFAGILDDGNAYIKEAILPLQKSYKLSSGLMYSVEGEELHRINVWLYQNKLKLLAQIHSHPQEAYHSETDDAYPIMSTEGGLSIVVPNFARSKMDHSAWAYYRLQPRMEWVELTLPDVRNLIELE
ncbi:MAG TPA: hypothetical protein VK508_12655 [Cyclobacteriaceae bacterium]|nr:hypothetical protein [Cyclobacteriaceae bacterium]